MPAQPSGQRAASCRPTQHQKCLRLLLVALSSFLRHSEPRPGSERSLHIGLIGIKGGRSEVSPFEMRQNHGTRAPPPSNTCGPPGRSTQRLSIESDLARSGRFVRHANSVGNDIWIERPSVPSTVMCPMFPATEPRIIRHPSDPERSGISPSERPFPSSEKA